MTTIKWGNYQFGDWVYKAGNGATSSAPVFIRDLSDKSGLVSIMFFADGDNDPKWYAQFYNSLSHLNDIFDENYRDIFEKEYHAQKMKNYVDEFLIRMDDLRAWS